MFAFSGHSGDFFGGPRLPSNWIADFRRLYDFKEAGRADLAVPAGKFNRAMRIDTTLVNPLDQLPGFAPAEANLAFRNLTRARMVRLATGQQMVTFLKAKGVTLTKLTNVQIRDGSNGADLSGLTQAQRDAILKNTPLWFYVLREAELNARQAQGRRRADRRRDVPSRDGGEPALDRARPVLQALARTEQPDVPDGRPPALRLRGQEGAAQPARRLRHGA